MIPSHFSHSGCHQEHKQQMQARMLGWGGEKEPSYTVGGNVN
jgi:hypothetical protein